MANKNCIPPQLKGAAEIMQSDEKRARMAHVLLAYTDCLKMRKVKDIAELRKRGAEYFEYCGEQRLIPTFEGLATYLGVSTATLLNWERGKSTPFMEEYPGELSEAVANLKGIVESIDGDLATAGDIAPISWIFRRKAISGWEDRATVSLVDNRQSVLPPPRTTEEIARLVGAENLLPNNKEEDDNETVI